MVTILKNYILLHIEFMRHIGMPFASYVLQSRCGKTVVPGEIHPFFVIPVKTGHTVQFFKPNGATVALSGYIKWLQLAWTPVFTGVTTYYEIINSGAWRNPRG
jgi:hypothetical protein